ncbi:MAG: cytochrome c-type biogenesis protein [Pseudomonadota bacterium]
MKSFFLIMMLVLAPLAVTAGEAQPMVEDPVLEKRVMALSAELRCLVCQNQSLADSHAELAADLRREVRDLMKEGKSDAEVVDYLVARYGDFVRYRPPVKSTTALLWFGPLILAVTGAVALFVSLARRRKRIADAALTDEQRKRAAALLNGGVNEEAGETKA